MRKSILLTMCCFCFNSLYSDGAQQDKPQRFYFIHVPKTGGTSLHTILENQIDLADLYPPRRFQLANQPVNHQLVSGHFPYWFCKQLDPEFDRAFKITILRNPIERYLSALRFRRRNFPELRERSLESVHHNPHTKDNQWDGANPNIMCLFLASNPNLTGKELLENAKRSLHTFDAVLFLDNFEQDTQKLCRAFNVHLEKSAVPNVNTTVSEEVSSEFMEVIKKHNELDIELYKYAKTHIKETLISYDFKASSQSSRKIEKLDYKFHMPLVGSNWCYRENIDRFSPEHPIYRWVMDKPATIFFNLKENRDYNMSFFAKSLTADTSPHLLVNGVEIPIHKKSNKEFFQYECKIPKELISDKTTEFTFFSPKSYRYNEINPGCTDNRKLSFALNRIKIKPTSEQR